MESPITLSHSRSIRDRIIEDEESSETLAYMVQSAHKVLVTSHNYRTFRSMLVEKMGEIIQEDLLPSFLCGMNAIDEVGYKKKDDLIDTWICELLRFLAMQALLGSLSHYEGDESDTRKRKLNPSSLIRQSWKGLMMLPLLYIDICKAFGCDVIDYEDEGEGEKSTSDWGRYCYLWTVESYKNLYLESPSYTLWPQLKEEEKFTDSIVKNMIGRMSCNAR